jgi:uncharacterized membrane protein
MDVPDSPPVPFAPRAVPMGHAFAWFEAALRMFKRAPLRWCVLGCITLVSELLLDLVPGIGIAAANVIVPVVECGMLIGAAAVDRGAPLEIRYATAAFRAPPTALAAIVLSALCVFAIEALVAYATTDANLLVDPTDARIAPAALLVVFGAGSFASLPFVFVPLAVLLQNAAFGHAFATSMHAFALNVGPLLLFGLFSLGLIVVGSMAFGVGLIAVFPILACANYAAWKDIYGGGAALSRS